MSRKLLITGASGDLGLATTHLAMSKGWQLAVQCRTDESANSLSQVFPGLQNNIFVGNLAESEFPEELVKASAASLGGIDAVIHFAGIQESRPVKATDASFIRHVMDTNVSSSMLLMRAFRDRRIPKSSPSFLLVSSIAAVRGHAGESAYAASKGAVLSLTRSYAKELANEGIRVNALVPGAVAGGMTDMIHSRIGDDAFERLVAAHPLGLGSPEDIASASLFMVSTEAKWITGTQLAVDGGYTA